MKNIKQFKKEIRECPNTPEAHPEDIKKDSGRHCSTCKENTLKLQTLQEVCEEIEKNPNFFLNDDAQELFLKKFQGEEE